MRVESSIHTFIHDIIHIMKVIQITIEPELLERIDGRCGARGRSAFFREAAELLLCQLKVRELERIDRRGYEQRPIEPNEFTVWYSEQVWPD